MTCIVENSCLIHNGSIANTSHARLNTSDFNWTLIRSFLAALDRGSLMAAARSLGTTQPTVGRHISELEAQLGVVLFERTGRGLEPTLHAQRLADAARAMASAADQLARQASGAQNEARGAVRISASQPVTCVLLPPVLLQMRLALPDIQFFDARPYMSLMTLHGMLMVFGFVIPFVVSSQSSSLQIFYFIRALVLQVPGVGEYSLGLILEVLSRPLRYLDE